METGMIAELVIKSLTEKETDKDHTIKVALEGKTGYGLEPMEPVLNIGKIKLSMEAPNMESLEDILGINLAPGTSYKVKITPGPQTTLDDVPATIKSDLDALTSRDDIEISINDQPVKKKK